MLQRMTQFGNPFLDLVTDFIAFQPEMCMDDILEAGTRMTQLLQHRVPDARLIDVAVVLPGTVRTSRRSPAALEARFVEVWFGH